VPRNFLISYSGRVGSTALIDTLKLVPDFLIPVFEELDYYAIKQAGQLDRHHEGTIHTYVQHIYQSRSSLDQSVGFKWRIWGDLDRIGAVLKEHDVLIFNLVRADLFEFVSSLYLSDIVNSDFNAAQFLLRDAETEEERQKILFKYRMTKHTVDIAKFMELMETQMAIEQKRFAQLGHLRALGCEITTIFYEDFAYKRFGFLNGLMRTLGHHRLDFIPDTKLMKVSSAFPSELFENRSELLQVPQLFSQLDRWERLVNSDDLAFSDVHA